MLRPLRVLAIAVGLCLLLGLGGVVALYQWTGSNDFRQRVERQASEALGVPVRLAHVTLDVWPLPAVVLEGLDIQAEPALTLERLVARPVWAALLSGRLEVSTLLVRKAELPQAAVVLLAAKLKDPARPDPSQGPPQTRPGTGEKGPDLGWLPRSVVLEDVTWVNAQGRGTTVQARLDLDEDGWPETADVEITGGAWRGASALLRRDGDGQTAWSLKLTVGGGTVQGPLKITPPPRANEPKARDLLLEGRLETRGVEVSALTAPSRPLTGRLDADTTLSVRIDPRGSAEAIAAALSTQTRFTVHGAQLQGLDLVQAVATVGLSRGGVTQLDTLTGQLGSRGHAVRLTDLVARSGVLSATGDVAVAPSRALSGRVQVDLTRGASGGLVGVPLVVGGTLDDPSVTLSRAALLGAAIGTAILPGVGTGAGVRLGDRLGEGLKDLLGK